MNNFKQWLLNERLVAKDEFIGILLPNAEKMDFVRQRTRSNSEEELQAYHGMANQISIVADFLEDRDDPRVPLVRAQVERSRHPASNGIMHAARELGISAHQYRYAAEHHNIHKFPDSTVLALPSIYFPISTKFGNNQPIFTIAWNIGQVGPAHEEQFCKAFFRVDALRYMNELGVKRETVKEYLNLRPRWMEGGNVG